MGEAQTKTWREIIEISTAYLKNSPSGECARTDCELLMARLLKCGRGFLQPFLDKTPSEVHLEAMRRGVKRLKAGEPVQYVLGEWDFRDITLKIDRRALIPRPETEELVTRVLKSAQAQVENPFVIDVCTGSGCIALSLAHEMKRGIFIGIDISPDAVALAAENAVRLGLERNVKFAVGDGLDDFDTPQCADIIVSNPPYIPSAECDRLDGRVKDWEPRLALDGGPEGLDFYERFLGDALNLLKPGGAVFFEIGHNQGAALKNLMFEFGFDDITVEKDFAGHDRYASAVLRG